MDIQINKNDITLTICRVDENTRRLERHFIETVLGLKKEGDKCVCEAECSDCGSIYGLTIKKGGEK